MAPRLLVLGTGWGATSFLRSLRQPSKWNITIASQRDHMLFTPLLASTATGALEHRSIIEPIRPLATQKGARFLLAEANAIESAASAVHFRAPQFTFPMPETNGDAAAIAPGLFSQQYDALVLAVGATVNTFNVPGVREHTLFMKEAADARRVRRRMHDLFEAASLPLLSAHQRRSLLTFVVCGAGPTGVELAAEISDWFADIARSKRYGNLAEEARVVLVEASGEILSSFDQALREYALRRLRKGRTEVKLGSAVREVHANAVVLADSKNGTMSERLPCGMVVWTACVGPRSVVADSDLVKDERGAHVLTDSHLLAHVKEGAAPVFAIGDCGAIEGNPLVPIAQVAEQQGVYVAAMLDRAKSLDVDDLRNAGGPFIFASKGMLAYVGSARGVASVHGIKRGNGTKGEQAVWRYSGFMAWMTWRFAYLSKLGSLRNKLQVPLDWFKTALFGRDVSSF